MKKNIFIIISCSLLIGASIKESAIKDMRAMYKEKVQENTYIELQNKLRDIYRIIK